LLGALHAALLAGDEDAVRLRRLVAAVSLVHVSALDGAAGEPLRVLDDGRKRVAIVRIAWQRLGVQHELAADGGLHAENVADQARTECHPTAGRPSLRSRSIKIAAREIISTGNELQKRIAKERRRIVGKLPLDLVHVLLRRKFLQSPA
jgi:hypothetical protein